ncbi:MAG: RNA-binding S4 domain-containing protein [Pyrinomonadaceae bacterium]|nr:RNA-binding S4 domain-containing protein [Pyrinomonadaceae bacterium]
MRLDLFLKASRLVLRRTVAQAMCDAGRVKVNGAVARSARSVQIGDEIALQRGERVLAVRILKVPTLRQTSRQEASTLYEILRSVETADESVI